MIYTFLKQVARISLLGHFRKIYISGLENVPRDKPVLFTPNHTNALVDPVVIAANQFPPTHFLTRADVFVKGVLWLFNRLHMYPIYRIRDGFDTLTKNEETFKKCFQILQKKGQIIIFSEGECEVTRKLMPLKKGTARMAFQALEEYNTDICIVPVGITYTAHTAFRSEIILHFGNAFQTTEFKEIYDKNKARGIKSFNEHLTTEMKNSMVNLNDLEEEQLLDYLLIIVRNEEQQKAFPLTVWSNENRLRAEQKAAELINNLTDDPSEALNDTKEKVFHYFQQLKKYKLKDSFINKKGNWLTTFFLLLLFPIFFVAMLPSLPLFLFADYYAKNKVKQDIFVSTFRAFLFGFVYQLVLLPIFAIALIAFMGWQGLLIAILIPIMGYLYLPIKDALNQNLGLLRYAAFCRKNKEKNNKLVKIRAELVEMLK